MGGKGKSFSKRVDIYSKIVKEKVVYSKSCCFLNSFQMKLSV